MRDISRLSVLTVTRNCSWRSSRSGCSAIEAAAPQARVVYGGDLNVYLRPDDPLPGFDASRLPQLLRVVFLSTGATHDDWPTYDRVMAEERRCAVLVQPDRTYGQG